MGRKSDVRTCDCYGGQLPGYPVESNDNRICENCNKEDVCMYKDEFIKAVKDVEKIADRVNVFMDTEIKCKKWSGKIVNYR